MEVIFPISQWLHRDVSLTLGSGIVALAICTVVLYHRLFPAADAREPPLIPYTVPWLGSALSFTGDFGNFIQWVRRVMPSETPYRIYMGGRTLYLITSPRLYAKFVRVSKTMSFDLLERDIFDRIFGMRKDDLDKFCVGMHGMPVPDGMTKQEAEAVAMAPTFMKQYTENWFGQTQGLEEASCRFAKNWEETIENIIGTADEVEVSTRNLIEHHVFWAASSVHFGTHLREIKPNAAELLWEFEAGFLKLFQGTSPWMLKGPIRARDELTAAIEQWTLQGLENAPNLSDDVLWDEWWGGRVLRQRDNLTNSKGLSLNGRAIHNFALLWALNANAIPAITWGLIYILRNPDLIPRLRAEIETAITLTPELKIDLPLLTKLPLFLSIYQESLRLTVANMAARIVTEDTELEGYLLKKGRLAIAPSYALHLSPVFDNSSHPATEFWAERFMVEGSEKSKLLNSWRPFAGGTHYCPGRYLAASEFFVTLGLLLFKFDMTLDERDGRIEHMAGRSGTGGVRPDRPGYISMRRRTETL
ncbi:hypothetical protein TWF730_011331 [Orbilia blumenaviensis]|uniref:Cytochrome P450 n=1 Tax=Orbilia blumenaviensis TaxID=1796055 RepID=A0AAV9UNT3_9PEZI